MQLKKTIILAYVTWNKKKEKKKEKKFSYINKISLQVQMKTLQQLLLS